MKTKNLYNNIQDNKNNIKWDYESDNKGLKCKVDSENQLNIFLQNSFEESNEEKDFNLIIKCIELFYSNDYQIVGIESNSLSGSYKNSYTLAQLLQPKIYLRYNFAQRNNSLNELYFQNNRYSIFNPDSCRPFNDYNDFIGSVSDNYGQEIVHLRTKIYNRISPNEIKTITQAREKLLTKGYTKKPTEILIFTDYISSGAAGLFIKYLQDNGGAIIAGYLGNPKINEDYDSSETASLYDNLNGTDIYDTFSNNGFDIKSVAYAESFDKDKTIYPLEYKKSKIDEKTNIIHEFNSNSYNEFISEAKTIFKKYNENKGCNSNNPNLLQENSNCYDPNNHLYGGYGCENGMWTNKCGNIYCDVGYYYDHKTKKCEIDTCLSTEYITLNFEGEKEYQIMPDISYIFEIQSPEKVFSLQSPIDDLIVKSNLQPCPRFCVSKNKEDKYFYVNYLQQISEPVTIKVTGISITNSLLFSFKKSKISLSHIQPVFGDIFYIIQLDEKEYVYLNTFDKGNIIIYSEYNDDMSLYDVTDINTKYFKEAKGKVIEFSPKKIYILAIIAQYAFVQFYFDISDEQQLT